MVEKKKNLSDCKPVKLPNPQSVRIGVVVSEWNDTITYAMRDGALQTLIDAGIDKNNIKVCSVPGSFELPTAAVMMLESDDKIDGVICIGCVIQGETRHFEFISHAVADGIVRAGVDYATPVIFGVLTCDTLQQAQDRSGGKHGNKGVEAAVSCLKMIALERKLRNS
ncbi:MAG: 6,7-dimethyl-8-ribityllumazine synthase [Bacteroidales bacterium]|jgi:6,7-dimethyl-8-ribityllumazine synthase|nr:6,7-dimethyl-8-ribityllumazine synthase [Bacteroidales bacterium]